jgi:MoaA/NifB/PqqE/SkfB family radical SAM enzyme
VKLEDIGFYTLSDERAKSATQDTPLSRCELILTGSCNFKCPYCRSIGGPSIDYQLAASIVRDWGKQGLKAIRFSGGEPLLYPKLDSLVSTAVRSGIRRIAISTNGSFPQDRYLRLLTNGVNDFSISLDACCADDALRMAGDTGNLMTWHRVVSNIELLSQLTYVTVGVVLTEDNKRQAERIVEFADALGVSDIRIIPAAQDGAYLGRDFFLPDELLNKYPILRYRYNNIVSGRPVRGIGDSDTAHCGLMLDDMAVMGDHHYPCIIYMREGGNPVGKMGGEVRGERHSWYLTHSTHGDPICRNNCLDVCVDYNNRHREFMTQHSYRPERWKR